MPRKKFFENGKVVVMRKGNAVLIDRAVYDYNIRKKAERQAERDALKQERGTKA